MSQIIPYVTEKNPEDIELNLRNIDITDPNILKHKDNRRRRSPIMVEFNDSYVSSVDIARALESGMNIMKFRMAFSTKGDKIRMMNRIDKAAERCAVRQKVPHCPVAISAALKTWVKKIGIFKHENTEIIKDYEVTLTYDNVYMEKCTSSKIYIDYPHIAKDIHIGQEVTMGLGEVVMQCTGVVDENSIKCTVQKGGKMKSMTTVHFRNWKTSMPYICKTDINILKFCLQYQVDILIIYYAKDGEMIKRIRHLISKAKVSPLVYSAICSQDGIDNLDEILKESDGIIFCRDFLQYELEKQQVYRMPMIQKWLAARCLQAGKPLFITGVFEYILAKGNVNDAEISDVTNALMDGVSGFILRYCSDINNTLYALFGLHEVCCQVEPFTFNKNLFWRLMIEPRVPVNAAEAAVLSCVAAANQTRARVVVLTTVTGRTARILLWLRPCSIVIAVCSTQHTSRLLYSCRNIVPLIYKGPNEVRWYEAEEAKIKYAAEFAVSRQWLEYGDMYVSLQKSCEGHLFSDVVRVWTVTFTKKILVECHYDSDKEQVSGEEFIEEKPKKKHRKKKKKDIKIKLEEEVKIEEEEEIEKDTKMSKVNIVKEKPTQSKLAFASKSAVFMIENEEEEEKLDEEDNEDKEDDD